jgi:hypothetical protein
MLQRGTTRRRFWQEVPSMPSKAERCTEFTKSHSGIDLDINQSLYRR